MAWNQWPTLSAPRTLSALSSRPIRPSVIIEPGNTELQVGDVISDEEWWELKEEHPDWDCQMEMGAEAVRKGLAGFLVDGLVRDGTELITLCLDGETGAEDWSSQVEFDGARVGANSSAAPTPAPRGTNTRLNPSRTSSSALSIHF